MPTRLVGVSKGTCNCRATMEEENINNKAICKLEQS